MMQNKSLTLVPMQAAHLPALVALEQICFGDPWSMQSLESELHNPHAHFVCAILGDEVAGYLGMYDVLDEGSLCNVAVHPDWRGRGIGRALVEEALAFAQQQALAFVTLEVRVSNHIAIALYQSLGFAEVGRRKAFYQNPSEDALLLRVPPVGDHSPILVVTDGMVAAAHIF